MRHWGKWGVCLKIEALVPCFSGSCKMTRKKRQRGNCGSQNWIHIQNYIEKELVRTTIWHQLLQSWKTRIVVLTEESADMPAPMLGMSTGGIEHVLWSSIYCKNLAFLDSRVLRQILSGKLRQWGKWGVCLKIEALVPRFSGSLKMIRKNETWRTNHPCKTW